MLITLPKLNKLGQVVKTTIINPASTFTGFEATTIRLPNGKKFPGTKVYTVDKGYFKIFCSPLAFGQGMQHVLSTGTPAEVPALNAPAQKIISAKATVVTAKMLTA